MKPLMTRREFGLATLGVTLLPASVAAILWTSRSASAQTLVDTTSESSVPDRNADVWMQQWKAESLVNKDLRGPLDLRRFKDPFYILLGPIEWKPKTATSALSAVAVPKGFVTDFASIPRVFWSIFRPDGNYAYAAVLHDYLYWQQDRPRSIADGIFRAAMDDLKITDWQSAALYHAVDMFGNSAWETNAKLKLAGDRRILSELPDNPEVTWEEWKSRPNVFTK